MVKTYVTGFKWVFPWPTQRLGFWKKKLQGWKITWWLNGVDTFRVSSSFPGAKDPWPFCLCPADLESCEGRRSEICAVSVAENTANVIWLVDFFHGRHLFMSENFRNVLCWHFGNERAIDLPHVTKIRVPISQLNHNVRGRAVMGRPWDPIWKVGCSPIPPTNFTGVLWMI